MNINYSKVTVALYAWEDLGWDFRVKCFSTNKLHLYLDISKLFFASLKFKLYQVLAPQAG